MNTKGGNSISNQLPPPVKDLSEWKELKRVEQLEILEDFRDQDAFLTEWWNRLSQKDKVLYVEPMLFNQDCKYDPVNSLVHNDSIEDLVNELNDRYMNHTIAKAKDIDGGEGIKALYDLYIERQASSPTRTTFNLTKKTVELLSQLDTEFGLSAREVFREAARLPLSHIEFKAIPNRADVERIKKTYVIDKSSLTKFKDVSKEHNVPRDSVIEFLVLTIKQLLENKQNKEADITTELLDQVNTLLDSLDTFVKESGELYGDQDHPVPQGISYAAVYVMNVQIAMETFLKNGTWEETT